MIEAWGHFWKKLNNQINLKRGSPGLDVTCTSRLTSLPSDLQAKFEFHHGDYEKQCLHALGRKGKAGMVMNNPTQSVFLFMDRQHLQVSQSTEIMLLLIW